MPKATNLILPPGRSSIGKPESWPLPREAARILGVVASSSIPVLCLGCGGATFRRIATSVHRASRRARLEYVDLRPGGLDPILALPRGPASRHVTVALDGLESLDPTGQDLLAAYLDEAAPRLLSATRARPDDLARAWREDLLSLLATVAIDAPLLRDRRDEIPRLAQERLETLCAELGIDPPPRLGPGATAALAKHDWPGDVTEFDAVLLATLLSEKVPPVVEATDLVWPRRPPEPASDAAADAVTASERPAGEERDVPTTHGPATTPPRGEPAGTEDSVVALESLAVELAHQLKNPLVAVKTFVSQAAHLDETERGRFQEIALRDIDRIDAPLERILAFSRLPRKMDEVLEVGDHLARSLAEAEALDQKAVAVHGLPLTPLFARGSAVNLDFAIATLCEHVAETIEPGSSLTLSRPSADQILLRYRESAAAAHLRNVTPDPDAGFPLALLLVRGALIRMGGGLRTRHARGEVAIELSFTPA